MKIKWKYDISHNANKSIIKDNFQGNLMSNLFKSKISPVCMNSEKWSVLKLSYDPSFIVKNKEKNLISLFSGAVFIENYNAIHNKICGVIMAFDRNNIRLWSPKYLDGSDKCE